MLISVDWVKEFVTLPEMNPKELGDKFTMSTAEVEEVKVVGDHLEKIRVSEVVSIEPHPNADKLRLVTFKISDGETKQVVCGAPNVKVGMKTPYAPLGTLLPNGLLLEPKKIRGIVSEGMLCSESELGISEESSGIMNLPNDAPLGETLLVYFNEKKDILIDVDNKSLTHRPDLWGHYGISREFAAVFGSKLVAPYDEKWAESYRKQCDKSDSPMSV
ncbi:MAG: phenylalanine--tRNA ligase subunit beta, partial [Bdellovibrionota bacterium]|nr:phenylalanine--tRNA ligase subunit beta [Bdellovibrionota bacterium]